MVRASTTVTATEDELADLQRRFHLLEGDRKAFYEASQWTIKQNKETLELVKEENKHFREALALLQKERGTMSEKGAGNTVEKLTAEVNELKKKYNELKHIARVRQKDLTARNDELRDLERDGARASSDNPLARQIRILDNKLEKANMKCSEAAAFRKTYDHIISRLKDEKRHFDVQLQTAMNTLKAKEADLAELIQMSTDAHRAKETAKSELARLEQTIAEERKIRQKELAERRKLVQAKIEVNQRMEQRERKRRELQLEAAGELNMDGEQNLIKNYVAQGFYSASAEHELQMQKDKVTTYEEAFRRIKEATGIEDINEVIEKFLTQDETQDNLTRLSKEAQARIDALNEEKGHAKAKVEEMRYAGPGTFGSRRIVDEYDAKLSEASSKCEKNRKRFDKMAKLLVNAKAGIEHLADRLDVVKVADQVKHDMSDETVLQILEQCELKLKRLVAVAIHEQQEGDLLTSDAQDEAATKKGAGGMELAANNVRIALSDNEEDSDDEGEEENEDEEMPLDRNNLKDSALAAVEKANRKGKARRLKREGG
eukprot:CAMPEP_0181310962 /NCGR_PEP_ID=MMETSP1101-20121128/12876_1 /TAXON_ID=46948 /ORGANISM="Rhodomonas abbreviata, Strain Caron Lab Isolate" /LENGTH=544 /DNA_ID=CAMNT_0023417647 /DNA_START=54 /DNA_END=1684 /DNA_ORIENTATION=+